MKLCIALVLVSIAAACCADDSFDREVDVHWEHYKTRHGKRPHPREELVRKRNFARTHAAIKRHNSANHTYTVQHNRFSDMHEHEISELLGGYIPKELVRSVWQPNVDLRQMPKAIDHRNDKCMSAVKNQQSCGCCWTFSAVASLEFSKCKKSGSPVILSEQQLVDCVPGKTDCQGGDPTQAWEYIKSAGGIQTTSDYGPYVSGTTKKKSGACHFTASKAAAKVASYEYIVNPGTKTTPAQNINAMMAALQAGTISVSLNVVGIFSDSNKFNPSLLTYADGIYSDPTCTVIAYDALNKMNLPTVNHAVALVGYGTSKTGIDYWILRNSWGPTWGQNGYVLIKKGVNMCNIESWVSRVVAA